MKRFYTFLFIMFLSSTVVYSQDLTHEKAISSLKLTEYLSHRSTNEFQTSNKSILVNVISHLEDYKLAELSDWISIPFNLKFLRALYPAQEKNPELFQKFMLHPRALLKEDRLILIKKIDEKLQISGLIFMEKLIQENSYLKALENPSLYKIDSASYEKLLNHFYYRLNDFKGSELHYILNTVLDKKGSEIINAINKALISFLKKSQLDQKNEIKK